MTGFPQDSKRLTYLLRTQSTPAVLYMCEIHIPPFMQAKGGVVFNILSFAMGNQERNHDRSRSQNRTQASNLPDPPTQIEDAPVIILYRAGISNVCRKCW